MSNLPVDNVGEGGKLVIILRLIGILADTKITILMTIFFVADLGPFRSLAPPAVCSITGPQSGLLFHCSKTVCPMAGL